MKKKISSFILGIFFALFVLEIFIRAGGFLVSFLQEERNRAEAKKSGTYKIICLGESTTAGQYPQPLEERLNQANPGIKFSVIDKGLTGDNTTGMLSRVQAELDTYKPDMVVVMAGINDLKIRYYQGISEAESKIFRHCRVYKLIRILLEQVYQKFKARLPQKTFRGNLTDEEQGMEYKLEGNYAQAEQALKKALQANPGNENAYLILGWVYKEKKEFPAAQKAFEKVLALNPSNDNAYAGLIYCYSQSSLQAAIDIFNRAVAVNPRNAQAYAELGYCYLRGGEPEPAEALLEKAIQIDGGLFSAYLKLGKLYWSQGRLDNYEAILKKALLLRPQDPVAAASLGHLYEMTGREELAREYFAKSQTGKYSRVTINNLLKLKQILDHRGIKLVCVQYPMRSIRPLREIFSGEPGVLFVDNQDSFKQAVKKEGARVYFRDMFAGDFGHCTEKGNRLIAGNIALVIEQFLQNK